MGDPKLIHLCRQVCILQICQVRKFLIDKACKLGLGLRERVSVSSEVRYVLVDMLLRLSHTLVQNLLCGGFRRRFLPWGLLNGSKPVNCPLPMSCSCSEHFLRRLTLVIRDNVEGSLTPR